MKRTLIITTLLSFLIVIAGSFTFAQPQRQNMRCNMQEMMKEKLNLTDEQQTQIEELRFDHQRNMIDLKADVEKKQLALRELQSTNNFTRSDYISKIEDIISAENKIKLERANHHMDVYELLDADQKTTWNKMKPMKYGRYNNRMKCRQKMNRF